MGTRNAIKSLLLAAVSVVLQSALGQAPYQVQQLPVRPKPLNFFGGFVDGNGIINNLGEVLVTGVAPVTGRGAYYFSTPTSSPVLVPGTSKVSTVSMNNLGVGIIQLLSPLNAPNPTTESWQTVRGGVLTGPVRYGSWKVQASGITDGGLIYGSTRKRGGAPVGFESLNGVAQRHPKMYGFIRMNEIGDSLFARPDSELGVVDVARISGVDYPLEFSPVGMNDYGQAVGLKHVDNSGGAELDQNVVWSVTGEIPIGPLYHPTDWKSSWAKGLNNSGVAVCSYVPNSSAYPLTSAFIWKDGVVRDLNDLIPHPRGGGWLITSVFSINDSGAILCQGHKKSSTATFWLVLTP